MTVKRLKWPEEDVQKILKQHFKDGLTYQEVADYWTVKLGYKVSRHAIGGIIRRARKDKKL